MSSLTELRELADKAVLVTSDAPWNLDSEDAAVMSDYWAAVHPRTVKALVAVAEATEAAQRHHDREDCIDEYDCIYKDVDIALDALKETLK